MRRRFAHPQSAFFAGPGAWMNETPEGLVAAALESGLLEKTFEGFANGLAPAPERDGRRLTDELETAAAILAARRARNARRRCRRRTALSTAESRPSTTRPTAAS